jgi:hypothetical protein
MGCFRNADEKSRGACSSGNVVRKRGVEPLPLAGLDPKSSASANSATFAKKLATSAGRHNLLLYDSSKLPTLGIRLDANDSL